MEINSICVFCGSSAGNGPFFAETAELLGKTIGKEGISLVYGGGNIGLMRVTAEAVLREGAAVTGVIPELINSRVSPLEGIKTIVTKDMHERKAKMYELSDAFIALPGGLGTLEELLEIFTWKHLGYHEKPVAILDINGFYTNLIKLMKKMADSGFLKKSHMESLIVADKPEKALRLIREHRHRHIDKWSG